MNTNDYSIGDTITYRVGAELRTVTVVNKESNIKNGRPGFDGNVVGDDSPLGGCWGYDDQIVRVGS